MQRRQLVQLAGAAMASAAFGAQAQSFPSRPIKLIVAFPAGGPTDITMRVLAENAAKILGQSVIVENKPGAGGTLPAQALQTVSPAVHHQNQLGPGQGHPLRAQCHRLRLWLGGAG